MPTNALMCCIGLNTAVNQENMSRHCFASCLYKAVLGLTIPEWGNFFSEYLTMIKFTTNIRTMASE
jgi:hypothetical protein